MRIGQPVLLGRGYLWNKGSNTRARSRGLERGHRGPPFALLARRRRTRPGNWIKVVQRVPVRVALDCPGNLPHIRCGRWGLSMEAESPTFRDQSGMCWPMPNTLPSDQRNRRVSSAPTPTPTRNRETRSSPRMREPGLRINSAETPGGFDGGSEDRCKTGADNDQMCNERQPPARQRR